MKNSSGLIGFIVFRLLQGVGERKVCRAALSLFCSDSSPRVPIDSSRLTTQHQPLILCEDPCLCLDQGRRSNYGPARKHVLFSEAGRMVYTSILPGPNDSGNKEEYI